MLKTLIISYIFITLMAAPSSAQEAKDDLNPELPTGITSAQTELAQDFMVVTADPNATKAAYDILKAGGSAADAAIAAQLVLGLTEPQSSGLGGGGFVLYYDAQAKKLTTFDGREIAPNAVTQDLFLKEDGQPIPFWDAVMSGKSVGVPGTPKLLEVLHQRYGKKDWQSLFESPIALAMDGFEVSERLSRLIAADRGKLDQNLAARQYFYNEDLTPKAPGEILVNPAYAAALMSFRDKGADAFYRGPIGRDIVSTARIKGSKMSLRDLSSYEVIERAPVCDDVKILAQDVRKVCSMAEPSSGGLTILQIFRLMEEAFAENEVFAYLQASRMAFADRNAYVADPAFLAKTPLKAYLLDPAYLQQRGALINNEGAVEVFPGHPFKKVFPEQLNDTENGTTHISIIDSFGNVLSMTSSIENAFGARIMTSGFLLNNQLTDFAFTPEINEKKVANRAQGGKRPRSSMAPTIIFDDLGNPEFVIGSAGGSRIIGYVAHKILQAYKTDKSLGEVLETPHLLSRGDNVEIEESSNVDPAVFERMGFQVEKNTQTSGMTAIRIKPDVIEGAADPRRNGLAMGE